MSQIIGSIYEIIGKLGEGGGGKVYLANHLNLKKRVVIKADKRDIAIREDLLRREVDVLKELRHSYIPQVYDYFIEDNVSYTVMDYIDGDSMKLALERKTCFSQPDVIHWAIQLLDALSYLHSPTHGDPPKGYVHSDIKPANIMLRPNGDVCLIDFNISLAIGIETVVGRSDGYSSPEHYGYDYSTKSNSINYEKTELLDDKTERLTDTSKNNLYSYTSSKRIIIPDARSDIYSLGATLYHLLSGCRPAKDAKEVVPLSKLQFSPPLVDIITKAMNPNPDLRYQSAEEMLQAFYDLWDKDPRLLRQKRQLVIGSVILSAMLAAGILSIFAGLRQSERLQTAQVLAAQSADYLSVGDVDSAIDSALSALLDSPGAFDIPYTAQAQFALTNAIGVYDLSDSFKPYLTIELPSAPFKILKTPDEMRLIVAYAYEIAIYDIKSGELLKTLPTLESALCEIEFLDETKIIYAGIEGLTAYDISADKVMWTANPATAIAISGDKTIVAAICRDESKISFYDTSTGSLISFRDLHDRHLNIPLNDRFADSMRDVFELNDDGSMCAVSLTGGCLNVLDIYNEFNDLYIYEASDYSVFDGEFIGSKFVYTAYGSKESVFKIVDLVTDMELGSYNGNAPMTLLKRNGELYLSQGGAVVKINPSDFSQIPIAHTENSDITSFDVSDRYVISATGDGFSAFSMGVRLIQTEEREAAPDFVLAAQNYIVLANRNSNVIEILKLKDYGDVKLMDYDPRITHNEARLAANGSVMLFSINGFTILNQDGSEKCSVELPDSDKIYDQQYRHDGDYLEVTYYSGKIVNYSASDGKIISESEISPPDDSLDEQLETKSYIIISPLHGVPTVIRKDNGKQIASLRSDDYLTYVTEAGEYLVAQYISTDGNFYGVLMNDKCEEIAILPRLCDITNDALIFDFPSGNIKASPIYSLDELKVMAKNYRN